MASEVNTLWPDNTTGQITPANARQTLLDIVASYLANIVSGTLLSGTTPQLLINNATADTVALRLQGPNNQIQLAETGAGGNLRVLNNNPISFGANNTDYLFIYGDGGTGVGTSTDVGPGHMIVATAVNAGGSGLLIGNLPACVATREGFFTYVTNGVTSPTYLGTVSTTGSTVAPVFCNGSNWVYH